MISEHSAPTAMTADERAIDDAVSAIQRDRLLTTANALISRFFAPLLGFVLFMAALWALHHALAEYHYDDIAASIGMVPWRQILTALALTAISYLIMTGYDVLAIQYIHRDLPYRKIGFAAGISYAFSNSVGLSILTAVSVRYRLYSAWGLEPAEIGKVTMFCALTLWLGILTLGGLVLLLVAPHLPPTWRLPFEGERGLGLLFLAVPAAYLILNLVRREPLRWRDWELEMAGPGLSTRQLLVGSLDWLIAGAVLYALLPEPAPGFFHFLGIFLIAQTVGLISHIPGGLGVFESLIILLLPASVPTDDTVGVLVVFRLIYYLLPLLVAAVSLGLYEGARHRHRLLWLPRALGPWLPAFLPQVFALTTLAGGAVLLYSAATPPAVGRMDLLKDLIPLPMVEASHFTSSLVGAALLLLARGLQRRLDAAWLLTVALLAVGIAVSLLKGVDYEEATVLALLLAGLLPCRRHFYRRSSLTSQRFTLGWLVTIGLVLLCTLWLGYFSFKHVEYGNHLWWQFSLSAEGDAPRFLRAAVGALVVVLFIGIAKLLRQTPFEAVAPDAKSLAQVRSILAGCPETNGHLALLGDKSLLFNASRTAFVMYAVVGRSWIVMGDPVGPAPERQELTWRFRELVEYHGGWPVFYQVKPANLDLYLELGLNLLKIGEEARVNLRTFSLDGKARKSLRGNNNRLEKEGYCFEVVPPAEVDAWLPRLREVSDLWLGGKNTREKRFSLGFFQEDYLRSCPIALVRRDAEVIAFANILLGAGYAEASVDLMRYRSDSPPGIMDFLFTKLMLWNKEQGYAWFNLGMAPLSGLQNRALAPLWNRFGALVFGRGERLYNFQGLHQYKDKFDPEWEPRYLAVPGGLALPRILVSLTSLIAGGLEGIIRK